MNERSAEYRKGSLSRLGTIAMGTGVMIGSKSRYSPSPCSICPASLHWARALFVEGCATVGGTLVLGRFATGCATTRPVVAARRQLLSLTGPTLDLDIGTTRVRIRGRAAEATTVNGGVPGPEIRLREGQDAVLRVRNGLNEDTSIHWHGLFVPPAMDGVPGVSFEGIPAGET